MEMSLNIYLILPDLRPNSYKSLQYKLIAQLQTIKSKTTFTAYPSYTRDKPGAYTACTGKYTQAAFCVSHYQYYIREAGRRVRRRKGNLMLYDYTLYPTQ